VANELVLKGLGWKDLPYWYRKFGGTDCLLPLNLVVGYASRLCLPHIVPGANMLTTRAFQLSLAVTTLMGYFWSLNFDFGVALKRNDPERNTRIQLIPDTEARRTAGGTASFTD
jgi:hypothetical protein